MSKEAKEILVDLLASIAMLGLAVVVFMYFDKIDYYFTFFSMAGFILMVVYWVLFFLSRAARGGWRLLQRMRAE
jgi:hypothetical protein